MKQERTDIQIGSRIREARKREGMTLKQVSEMTGLSVPYLSLLERDMNNPTVEHLNTVCRVLDIALPDLITRQSSYEDIVVRADQRRKLFAGHGYDYEAATNGKGFLSCIVMTITDDTEHFSQPHISDEIGYVLSGEIIYTVNGKDYRVRTGDCIYIAAGSPHSYRKLGEGECVTIWFSTARSRNMDLQNKHSSME